jgi:hypothetical protein
MQNAKKERKQATNKQILNGSFYHEENKSKIDAFANYIRFLSFCLLIYFYIQCLFFPIISFQIENKFFSFFSIKEMEYN